MPIDSCVVDTNILLRIARYPAPQHEIIRNAVAKFKTNGTALFYTQQSIVELWNVMTARAGRPLPHVTPLARH
jgi:predicted nucleic acid-binding protein